MNLVLRPALCLLCLLGSPLAQADIVPPHPPPRGTVAHDLPPPAAPGPSTTAVAVTTAVGACVTFAIGGSVLVLVGQRRRREA